jgi:hypothetical protein
VKASPSLTESTPVYIAKALLRGVLVLVVLAAIAAAFLVAGAHASRAAVCHRPTTYDLTVRLPREWPQFKRALQAVHGSHWQEAAIVSFGESSWHPDARNGQYLGYFQMGSYERSVTGWTSDVYGQVRAADRWNKMTGGGWRKWDCRP